MKINLFNRAPEDSCNGDIAGIPTNVRDLQGFLFYGGMIMNKKRTKEKGKGTAAVIIKKLEPKDIENPILREIGNKVLRHINRANKRLCSLHDGVLTIAECEDQALDDAKRLFVCLRELREWDPELAAGDRLITADPDEMNDSLAGNIDLADLKTNMKRQAHSLRYLYGVMDECAGTEDFEPCLIMSKKFIQDIAEDLELEAK